MNRFMVCLLVTFWFQRYMGIEQAQCRSVTDRACA